jgi:MoxR-like ATPase
MSEPEEVEEILPLAEEPEAPVAPPVQRPTPPQRPHTPAPQGAAPPAAPQAPAPQTAAQALASVRATTHPPAPSMGVPGGDLQAVEQLNRAYKNMSDQLGKVIVGQQEVIEQVLTAMFCQGHILLVGVPGLAKTLLVKTISDVLNLAFKRVQFTPDLMPSDITGTDVLEEDRTTGKRAFRFVKGPLFCNMLLADEINRTPPKTQAALLEAMQEHRVTAGDHTYELPEPFFVLATQNPIEQEGTYPLPEAQLDRFMFMTIVRYPTPEEETRIMKQATTGYRAQIARVLDGPAIQKLQEIVRRVPVAEHVYNYARDIVRATRPKEQNTPKFIDEMVQWGAGPRASIYLILAGKARAILNGRVHVTTEDIQKVAHPILRHRILPTFSAEAAGMTSDKIIDKLIAEVPKAKG